MSAVMKRQDIDVQPYLDHFSPTISKELADYALNEVFKHSRYIFTRRQGKQMFGYCTHCNLEHLIETPAKVPKKAKTPRPCSRVLVDVFSGEYESYSDYDSNGRPKLPTMECPNCHSTCYVKSSGRGHKSLLDRAYFTYYEKSIKDPAVIVARGMYVIRDYGGDYKNVETYYREDARYVFQMRHSMMFKPETIWSYTKNEWESKDKWVARSSVYPLFNDRVFRHGDHYQTSLYSRDSIKTSVSSTPFQYSAWENYDEDDMVKFFAAYSKAPCIEYLTKLGMSTLVIDKLKGCTTKGIINWRGKNPLQVLKLTKQEMKEIRTHGITVTLHFLNLLQMFKKQGINLTLPLISELDKAGYYIDSYNRETFDSMLQFKTIPQAHAYLKRQSQHKQIITCHAALIAWRDYLRDCKTLGLDLNDESIRFPRDLYRAHQNTITQIRNKADRELDRKIKPLFKKLSEKYNFEYSDLFIRPAKSARELINEGKKLHHCVGTYAKQYANGTSILLLIRQVSKPGTPYYTMEIRGNKIVQCRGLRNCPPVPDVNAFIEAFKKSRLEKKPRSKKVKIPA